MEKRVLIAIVLSIAVLVGYQYLFVAPMQRQQQQQMRQAAEAEREAPKTAVERPPVSEVPEAPIAEPLAPKPADAAKEVVVSVETDLYSAELSSIGGTVKGWTLKKFSQKDGRPVSLIKDGDNIYQALAIGVRDDFKSIAEAGFEVVGGDLTLNSTNKSGMVVFKRSAGDYSIKRTFTFHNGGYDFELVDEVEGLPGYQITLGADFGINERKDSYAHVGPILLQETDRIEVKAGKLDAERLYTDNIKWVAIEDKYFFSGIVPQSAMNQARVWKYQDSAAIALKGAPGVNRMTIYAGPKEHDRLKALGLGLEHVVDFGFFSPIARPLFWILKKFYSLVGNYGWAIVLLTIVVRVPFIPLVNKGQESMKKLQEVQPKMNELKEKFKNDPKRMQEETMALYRKHKVNPVGGCLPMLAQIPVFFALYKVLLVAIELRSAPFIFWLTDLSQKDPYYVLPLVMGATMFIQQKMTPTAGDPRQQKIMMFMPVIFTFMFLNFASGLVLYWLVNNLLSIAQQSYVYFKKPR